jgi:membrane associated rhomboid family serine protease
VVTYALIAVNLAAFAATALQARSAMDLSGSALYLHGGLIPVEVAAGEWWRVLTAGFLHGNLVHMATNMLSLYMLGIPLERILGRLRLLAIYGLSLLGASVSVLLFSAPVSLTIGASGAVYGLMGALLITFKRLGYDLRQLLVIIAINIWVTFQFPGISWQGHLGGLVVGAVLGAAMVYPPRATRRAWQVGTVVGVSVVLVGLFVFRTDQIGDWTCVYEAEQISCVPSHALLR